MSHWAGLGLQDIDRHALAIELAPQAQLVLIYAPIGLPKDNACRVLNVLRGKQWAGVVLNCECIGGSLDCELHSWVSFRVKPLGAGSFDCQQ